MLLCFPLQIKQDPQVICRNICCWIDSNLWSTSWACCRLLKNIELIKKLSNKVFFVNLSHFWHSLSFFPNARISLFLLLISLLDLPCSSVNSLNLSTGTQSNRNQEIQIGSDLLTILIKTVYKECPHWRTLPHWFFSFSWFCFLFFFIKQPLRVIVLPSLSMSSGVTCHHSCHQSVTLSCHRQLTDEFKCVRSGKGAIIGRNSICAMMSHDSHPHGSLWVWNYNSFWLGYKKKGKLLICHGNDAIFPSPLICSK